MRTKLALLMSITMALVPIVAQASGCLAHHTVVGPVQPEKPLPPQVVPARSTTKDATQGTPYALYWLFHHWCSSCQDQAGVIKAFRERYRNEVQLYAVPLSGSEDEVKRFLSREGLSTLPVLREARGAFGEASQHPVLVFGKRGPAYYRINGHTPLPALEQLFAKFKRT